MERPLPRDDEPVVLLPVPAAGLVARLKDVVVVVVVVAAVVHADGGRPTLARGRPCWMQFCRDK